MPVRRITSTALSLCSSRNLSGHLDSCQLIPRKRVLGASSLSLRETVEEPDDALAVFAGLLGIPIGTRSRLDAMSPLQKKWLLFRTFLAQLERLSVHGPVLMVLEDAHLLHPH